MGNTRTDRGYVCVPLPFQPKLDALDAAFFFFFTRANGIAYMSRGGGGAKVGDFNLNIIIYANGL